MDKAVGVDPKPPGDVYDWKDDIIACPGAKDWGLTYDDGPSALTPQVLDVLKDLNVKATFFVVGWQVLQFPEILLRAYQEGHQIALHSWSHQNLPSISMDAAIAEVVLCAKVVAEVLGVTPAYFRPPYGANSESTREMLKKLGMYSTMWNVDSDDWKNAGAEVVSIFQKQANSGSGGVISLQHDIAQGPVSVVRDSLNAIMRGSVGYKPMPVSQCIGKPAYSNKIWEVLGVPVPGGGGSVPAPPQEPSPAAPSPAAPSPAAPSPAAPSPAAPSPAAPSPVDTTSAVAPSPAAPSPVAPSPVAPSPAAPAPATGSSATTTTSVPTPESGKDSVLSSGATTGLQTTVILLGRALDPGVENVYTWLRGGVLNGEADLDQRWLDGTVEHESMGTRHDNRALAARLADFLQVAYRQYQSTLWKYHRDRLVEVG
ncbi:hypothetical protein BASA50_001710 [Batrachochytrium salamandrivorans]|uniref:NodB homology domain-containing protein n=1 Tax=Batrachochytrium salamandrivorans TaxID=1357716 RepID=A0ABQ8FRG5_9FUNG|nr:hypothetical protein BASA50_001710 [Batrachochytrium salamandrivorans]